MKSLPPTPYVSQPQESEIINKDGGIWLHLGSPVRDENGDIIGILVRTEDITERKQAEEELKKRVDELERFHDLTVDRELKMVELKEEIEALKAEKEKLESKGDNL